MRGISLPWVGVSVFVVLMLALTVFLAFAHPAHAASAAEETVPIEDIVPGATLEDPASSASTLYPGESYTVVDEDIFEYDNRWVVLFKDILDFDVQVVNPTCTEFGYTLHTSKTLFFPGFYKDMKTAPLGHRYEDDSVVEPTCTTDGAIIQKCVRCDDTQRLPGEAALGHAWSEPVWSWSADYSSATMAFSCQHDASHVRSARAAVAHEMTEAYVRHVATAQIDGVTYTDVVEVPVSNPVVPPEPSVPDPIDPTPTDPPVDPVQPTTPEEPNGGVRISIDPAIPAGFSAKLEGAPGGSVALSVRNVTEGPAFDALAAAVSADASAASGNLEIVGVFDIDLAIDDTPYSENFGSLTLELPIGSKYDYKWATVYHCHGNDANDITSYDRVIVRDGKSVLTGVTKLSQFAVAVGDSALKRPVALSVKRPVPVYVEEPVAVSFASSDTKGEAAPASAVVRHVRAIATGEEMADNLYASMPSASSQTADGGDGASSPSLVGIMLASMAVVAILAVLLLLLRRQQDDAD